MILQKTIIFLVPFVFMCFILSSRLEYTMKRSTHIYQDSYEPSQLEKTTLSNMNGHHIVAASFGRLGNQLMIYASLYAVARKTSRIPIFCSTNSKSFLGLFPQISAVLYNASPKKCRKDFNLTSIIKQKHEHIYYDRSLIQKVNASTQPYMYICCHFQNMQYFVDYLDDIKLQLKIGKQYRAKANTYLFSILKMLSIKTNKTLLINDNGIGLMDGKLPIFVAIHVRRGDIVRSSHLTAPGSEYFEKAKTYFKKKYGKNVIFIVITNGLLWCKVNLNMKDAFLTGESGKKTSMEDFSIAISCNHTIMSVGTYSWWVGFLTGGDVVYAKNFAAGNWIKWYRPKEHFPPNWLGMNMTTNPTT